MIVKAVTVSKCRDNVVQSHCFHRHRSNDILEDIKIFRMKNQICRDLVTIAGATAHFALLLHVLVLYLK